MFGNLSGPTLLVVLFIVLLLFGAPKLPGLAKSLGQSMRILKKEVRSDDSGSDEPTTTSPAQPRGTDAP
ncbi:Twin-arginine translocation protein TatA [Leucobacter sp. 7(1)]|uniref:twin-arginine translocase TatA/TatE family subunit n=1 Tax=Leucobacter sp. 7(1) TaxID=1255613 RepID=UPI00097EC58C|nr:twin-arginine translocase TatA/TatE family subunit [Leucobacter sp. 7(1)]SJN10987.1 Twin-arginine translocation protein TatA [Leucobacter sp. 7(1)]